MYGEYTARLPAKLVEMPEARPEGNMWHGGPPPP